MVQEATAQEWGAVPAVQTTTQRQPNLASQPLVVNQHQQQQLLHNILPPIHNKMGVLLPQTLEQSLIKKHLNYSIDGPLFIPPFHIKSLYLMIFNTLLLWLFEVPFLLCCYLVTWDCPLAHFNLLLQILIHSLLDVCISVEFYLQLSFIGISKLNIAWKIKSLNQ